MITQLQTPIPIETPKGKAWAVAIIDYGPQWDLQWISFVHSSGECWTFRNSQIRQGANFTFGIPAPTSFDRPSVVIEKEEKAKAGLNGKELNGNKINGHKNGKINGHAGNFSVADSQHRAIMEEEGPQFRLN